MRREPEKITCRGQYPCAIRPDPPERKRIDPRVHRPRTQSVGIGREYSGPYKPLLP